MLSETKLHYSRSYYARTKGTRICVMLNGKATNLLHVNKRPIPSDNICENCGKPVRRLEYHHWDDSDFSKGIWVCWRCHRAITFIEGNIGLKRYLELRNKLDRGEKL